jgi:VanZ family protein
MSDARFRVRRGIYSFLLKIPAPLIGIVIWFLSAQSILPQPKGILGFDKLQHFIAYFVLAASIIPWFSPRRRIFRSLWMCLPAALIASGYGIVDELHQYFVPGRDCNVWDWIADTLGAVFGAFTGAALMNAFLRRWERAVLSDNK